MKRFALTTFLMIFVSTLISGCDQRPSPPKFGYDSIRSDRPWIDIESINDFDDSKKVTLMKGALMRHRGQRDLAVLILKCKSGETLAYINWEIYLGVSDTIDVRFRAGNHEAVLEPWHGSTDNTATFALDPVGLINQLLVSDKFIIETTPYGRGPLKLEFEMTDLQEVFVSTEFAKVCGWNDAAD